VGVFGVRFGYGLPGDPFKFQKGVYGHNVSFTLIGWWVSCAWVSVSYGQAFTQLAFSRAVLTNSNEEKAPSPQRK
jgi:hypothetical protein